MSAGTPLTGNAMTFKISGAAIEHTSKWMVKGTAAKGRYASNSTSGGRKTTVGVKDWTGSATVFIHAGATMAMVIGTEYSVVLHGTASSDTITGTIMVTDVGDITFDADSGEPVACDFTFDFQGIPTGAGAFTLS
jgi:hypothetical protein